MATGKRTYSHGDNDSDAEDDSQRESAQLSPSANGPNKRRRVSDEGDKDQGTNMLEPSSHNVDGDQVELYDMESNDEDAEIKDDEAVIIRNELESHKVNIPAEYGVIEEVLCRNFMCHSKLRIKLGPLINFIIGHNGSGKSAVLTALTLCLGAKATSTNRGTSLKHLIKQGEESATLSVKIKNQGEMAYRPDLYGESIIVERHFSRAGTSGFKLKNANDKIISTKKVDLEDMLDYLALQLDNPMNVLTQDLARQFLSNSTPRDKYKFFMRGTQLEQLDRDYRMIEETTDSTEAKLEHLQEDVKLLTQKLQAAEEKKKRSEASAGLLATIAKLRNMHVWAQVEVVERELVEREEEIKKSQDMIDRAAIVQEAKSNEYDTQNRAHENAVAGRTSLDDELNKHRAEHGEVKDKFEANKTELINNSATRRRIQEDLTIAKKEIDKCEQEIQKEQARIEAEGGPAQAQRLIDLEEAGRQIKQRTEELNALDQGSLMDARMSAERNVKDRRRALQPKQEALRGAENMLNGLRSRGSDTLSAYHTKMPMLLRAIDNERGFSSKPIGPMGMHMRLKKPQWSSIIETVFGGSLEAFIVTNHRDRTLLSGIVNRLGMNITIYVGRAEAIDVTRNEPDASVDTILRVLEITNELVRNQIIIHQNAEQTVLFEDRQAAFDWMEMQTDRNHHTKVTIGMHDTQRGWGIRFVRGQGSGPVRAWGRAPRIQTDIEAQLRSQQAIVEQHRNDLGVIENDTRTAERELQQADQALTRFSRQVKACKEAVQRAEDREEELKNQIQADRIETGVLETLTEQLSEAKATEGQHEGSYKDAIDEKDRINDRQKSVKTALDAATSALSEVEAKVRKAENRIVKLAEVRQRALAEKNAAFDDWEQAARRKADAERRRDRTQAELDDHTTQATAFHHRVPVDEGLTADIIDERLVKLSKDHEIAQRRAGGTHEEIKMAWLNLRNQKASMDKVMKQHTDLIRTLKQTLNQRQFRWRAFRAHITARAKFMFTYLLKERAFRGKILVNHNDMAMDIYVEPDHARSSDKGRQTKTLSGGEKSFSTICMLLSIWEAMGSPIRCLDEFDVFMDNVNRDISMKMMIQAARRSISRQFILITPQSMGNVQLDGDVKIHKMTDPERGQTALPFGS